MSLSSCLLLWIGLTLFIWPLLLRVICIRDIWLGSDISAILEVFVELFTSSTNRVCLRLSR
jgi:hypothetical protein